MTLTVEVGLGIRNADSYVTLDEIAAHALATNQTWDPDSEQAAEGAARNATRYIDGTYRWLFTGMRLNQRDQNLEWPRANAVCYGWYGIGSNEIPRELKTAVCEAAIRDLASPGVLFPDTSTSTITDVKADTVSISFGAGGYTGQQSFPTIAMALAPLLNTPNPFSLSAGRG